MVTFVAEIAKRGAAAHAGKKPGKDPAATIHTKKSAHLVLTGLPPSLREICEQSTSRLRHPEGVILCVAMRTTIELPDSVYRKAEKVARTRGVTLEELIIRAFERELVDASELTSQSKRVVLVRPSLFSSNLMVPHSSGA